MSRPNCFLAASTTIARILASGNPTVGALDKIYVGYGFKAISKQNGMSHTFYTHPADPTRIRATLATDNVDQAANGRDLAILRANIAHLQELYGHRDADPAGAPEEISLEQLRAVLLSAQPK